MTCNLRFLARHYLTTVLIFVAAKVVFMLVCREGHDFSMADMGQVVAHGLSLDLSTALYFLIVPFLLMLVTTWWPAGKWLRRVLTGYNVVVAVAFALAFVADASLYPFWGYKLDATCLQYLDTPTEAAASVTTGYLLWRLAAVVVTGGLIYCVYALGVSRLQTRSFKASNPEFQGFKLPVRSRIARTVLWLALVPAIVIGIRGGLDESTTNVGQVYFSQNQFLNHSAVNPVFSFLASFEKSASENTVYSFYTAEEMQQLTDGLYDSTTPAGDTLLNTRRPNVIVILLESCGKMFLEVMPNLRQAAAEGVDFTQCYGNSYRTDRGTTCALSGYLSFPTMSVMKMSNKVGNLSGIARTLSREGYATEYLYGGDINFTKMKGYLISTGFGKLHWKQDYTQEEQNTSKWGVRDDITFKTLSQMVRSHRQGEPFLIGYSTLSSHEPWDVPVNKYREKQFNGFSYVDDCIGEFISDMKRSEYWDNLLIVFMPDHSTDFRDITEQHPTRNLIPMVWTGGAVKSARKLDRICNQSDFAATLLGQMGISHEDFTFSRDVTSNSYRYPFAVHMFNNGISMADSTGFMLYDLNTGQIMVKTSAEAERMARTAKAVLQLASEDLNKK